MSKPEYKYIAERGYLIFRDQAYLVTHESDTRFPPGYPITTSNVVSFDKATGRIETAQSVYTPDDVTKLKNNNEHDFFTGGNVDEQ